MGRESYPSITVGFSADGDHVVIHAASEGSILAFNVGADAADRIAGMLWRAAQSIREAAKPIEVNS